MFYPYISSGVILTDSVYKAYGGWTGTSNDAQRNAAYVIAEQEVTRHVEAYLLPTYSTGSYNYPLATRPLELDTGIVTKVVSVKLETSDYSYYISGAVIPKDFILDYQNGYVNKRALNTFMLNRGLVDTSLALEIVYESGLPSGVSCQPMFLAALTMAADLVLRELVDPGSLEGGAGDIGVQGFSSNGYSEQRMALGNSIFGNSPRANKIKRMLTPYVVRRALAIGR